MAKSFYACNWVPSRVTEEQLNGCVATGALAKKEVIHWRAPGPKNPPEPKDGEVIVLIIWVEGLALPDQKISAMCLLASNSTLKILDLTPCPIFAIFKCSVKLTCKKSPQSNCSEISTI